MVTLAPQTCTEQWPTEQTVQKAAFAETKSYDEQPYSRRLDSGRVRPGEDKRWTNLLIKLVPKRPLLTFANFCITETSLS